jgi:transcriptional regulator with GAF, ATPase, and Fis domain/tetratricopeptide (TPR) repeat protein
LRDLTRTGAAESVLQAEVQGRVVALRLSPSGTGRESRAELAVLAAVAHPNLAALVGHGSLAGGGTWIAREWIDGVELGAWSSGRPQDEIGRVLARLCVALDHLHERGFVHGDLKPSNVIVAAGDRPVLTDFGLARRAGSRSAEIAGTPFGIAPEVLLGGTPDARADLFALGVMLHELLVRRRPTAREFYGHFPGVDFFEATRTAREELPPWARDLVSALVEREPRLRPNSAAEVGRALAGRLGLVDLFRAPRIVLRWPVSEGREAWIEHWLAPAAASNGARFEWLRFETDEAPRALLDDLALRAALQGTRVHGLDLRAEVGALRDAAQLDTWVIETGATLANVVVFVALESDDAWLLRALEQLARTLARRRDVGLIVGAPVAIAPPRLAWRVLDVAPVTAAEIAAFLRRHMAAATSDVETERLERFAELLGRAARGSAARLDRALDECARDGWFLAGEETLRLRPGPLPESLGASRRDWGPQLEGALAMLLAALHVGGDAATVDELEELAQLGASEFARTLAEAVAQGDVALAHTTGETRVRPQHANFERLALADSDWRALHQRRAEQLARAGAAASAILPHLFRAGLRSAAQVVAECEQLRDRGCAELALHLCETTLDRAKESNMALPARLIAERAFAWVALGQPDRALEAIAAWSDESALDASTRALAARVRGQVASLKHEPDAALEHFERAFALEPRDDGAATLARLRLLYELQRDREVVESMTTLRERGHTMQPRSWANAQSVEAMSLFRLGQIEPARALLAQTCEDARASGDPVREAATRINLATIERRAGDAQLALEHLERAAELYDRCGVVSGLAQARAMLASALRDAGELARAQPLLASALAIRERLGDHVGAAGVRGMLGLLFSERGHIRAAIEELEQSAHALRATHRKRDALLLEARASEARGRIGDHRAPTAANVSEVDRAAEGDPRVLVSLARAAWLSGNAAVALDLARRAAALAQRLGLTALYGEAQFLLRRLNGDDTGGAVGGAVADSVRGDERVHALLSRAPLDSAGALALAKELAARGRDDRAARLMFAVAARAPAGRLAHEHWQRADELFAACCAGLSAAESAALRHALLGMPDPWPEDFVAYQRRHANSEEDDMEVVRLLEINHRLVAQEDLRTLLGTIVEQALAVSGAQRGFLILEEDGELKVDTALDSRRGDIESPDVEVSGSVLRDALARMSPVRVSNAIDDPLLGAAPSVISLELRSILCVPFEVQKGLRGVIYVDHRLREGAFDARTERMLTLLADQAALAIGQVRRLEEIRRLNRELGRQVAHRESDLRTAKATLRAAGLPAPAGGLVGNAPVMQQVRALIERAAQAKLPVLVTGPSGCGKELASRALHELGPRSEGPFVSENCAALPPSLIEAELFGARRGAFTGADRDRIGLFERAHGGTLFLDEVGELPLDLQAKLLRVLETSEVRRLGDDSLRNVDFRLVAATNRDLVREVREGRFREDLFYRLDALRIELPPLSAHPEDIPVLVDHCLRLQAAPGEPPAKVAPAVLARLCKRDWPGNVRELFNEVARLVVLSGGEIVDPALVREAARDPLDASVGSGAVLPLEELERRAILRALEVSGGDKRKAAQLLGISRAKVYQRLKEWGEAAGEA